ncbi:hypothetical protein QUD89_07145, partial [Klebsiella pneumoniae]|nr:hypothetical protein [Klebsiella pneumoniae]
KYLYLESPNIDKYIIKWYYKYVDNNQRMLYLEDCTTEKQALLALRLPWESPLLLRASFTHHNR